MSKFTEHLRVDSTEVRRAKPLPSMPSLLIKDGWLDDTPKGYSEYRVHISLAANFILHDDLKGETDAYLYGVSKTKQMLVEELFGEFRKPLLDVLHKALSVGEPSIAEDIDKILDQMFKL